MQKIVGLLLALGALTACSEERLRDVSDQPEFRPVIGARFEVVGELAAYGIRQYSGTPVEYVTLIPPPGIVGPEVGFRVPVSPGSRVTVLKVLKSNRWTFRDLSYVVRLEGTQLPVDVPIRIDHFHGNEGKGKLDLNPDIYRPSTGRQGTNGKPSDEQGWNK